MSQGTGSYGGARPPAARHAQQASDGRDDPQAIRYLRDRLADALDLDAPAPGEPLYLQEPEGRQHRVIVLNRAGLHAPALTFVAFLGYQRADADRATLEALDGSLVSDFAAHPAILSYSSLERADGSWANLVVMATADGIAHWSSNERHAHAAHVVAPRCYTAIRLHRGLLPLGLRRHAPLEVRRTQRFAFA